MEYWEFLLQKEGDQSWLPLDASQVEILEGRYRVMAHTSQVNSPVQIQISQVVRQAGEPKRRTLRRRGETNASGLMVVMPFTHLAEGTWEIHCGGAAAAARPWHYAVQLQVVAQGEDEDGGWFADDDSAGSGAAAAAPLDLEAAAAALDAFQAQVAAGLATDYRLTLPHSALLVGEGEPLGLLATLDRSDSAHADSAEPLPPLTLVVRLSDPQTAAAIALTATPLAAASLPASVTLTVAIPPGLSTRLLLGEVGLLAGAKGVALQRFTVTVDVASLFNAIANQAETEPGELSFADAEAELEAEPKATPGPNPDTTPWEPLVGRDAPPRAMPILTLPRSSPALPPKIYYPTPHEAASHQPTLPPVGSPRPPAPPSSPGAPSPEVAPRQGEGQGLRLPPLPAGPRAVDPIAALQGQGPRPVPRPEPQLPSHEAMGFRDLKLQERFWHRLNELAVNLQQQTTAQAMAPAGAAEAAEAAETEPAFVPFQGEVVIYEDEDPTLARLRSAQIPEPDADAAEVVTPPMPSLVLPEGELTAGESVLATLRVPFHPNRLYLKVWITDPQTRTLADEPRQVMNLLPNGQGELEGSLQLTVPLGCLEAWFEAIAVDMVTQQESYKASVSRPIAPAGLLPADLDDLEI